MDQVHDLIEVVDDSTSWATSTLPFEPENAVASASGSGGATPDSGAAREEREKVA